MSYIDQITVGSTTYDIKDANAIAAPSSASSNAVLTYDGDNWVAGAVHSIPAGGLAEQILVKSSNDDYNVTWASSSVVPITTTEIDNIIKDKGYK